MCTGVAALLVCMLCGASGVAVRAAEDTSAQKALDSAMGKMKLIEWSRVTSESQLRACTDWTPMLLYQDFATVVDIATAMNAEYSSYYKTKGYCIMDENKTGGSEYTYSLTDISEAVVENRSFIELLAPSNVKHANLRYTGSDDKDNDNAPKCEISLNTAHSTYLGWSNKKLDMNAQSSYDWTILTKTKSGRNYVSLFHNLKGGSDPTIWLEMSDRETMQARLYGDTAGGNSSYQRYAMYLGKVTDITVIQKDITVGEGQTVRISASGGVALQANRTLTIEKGGTAIIESRFLNQGTIVNHGTIVVMDGGSLQPIYDPGSGTITCDGGDIVILSGGRMLSTESLKLTNGSSVVNSGVFMTKKTLTLDNASLITEKGGYTFLGFSITTERFMNADISTAYVSTLGKTTPCLSGASATGYGVTLQQKAKLINRGGKTVLTGTASTSGGAQIVNESGTLYK